MVLRRGIVIVVAKITYGGQVIELKDVVLLGSIVIAVSDIIAVSIAVVLKKLVEGDGLIVVITSRGLVGISLGAMR